MTKNERTKMIDDQMWLMKKVAQTGGGEDAWRYGCACLNGAYELYTGVVCSCPRNVKEGVRWLKIAAKRGSVGAMIELGCYYDSLRREKYLWAALYWEKSAWRKGAEFAGNNIALTYSRLGMKRRCHEWLERSYKRCPWSACVALAKTYLCGYGVRRDVRKAERLFNEVLSDSESVQEDRRLARHYLKMIKRGEFPDDDRPYP